MYKILISLRKTISKGGIKSGTKTCYTRWMRQETIGQDQAISSRPSNNAMDNTTALPQFPALPPINTAPLLTLPVGLLGSFCVVLAVAATMPVPKFALTTITVEFSSHFCSLNGGGPQYDSFALVESEDST